MTSRRSRASADRNVDALGERLGTATVFFHAAVAERFGLSVTDAKCCSVLAQVGPMTASTLAHRLRLTTGAVTGLVDRLERAKLVRRVPHAQDRRSVLIELVRNPKRERELARLFAPLRRRVHALVATQPAALQAALGEFIAQVTMILEEETDRMRAAASLMGTRE